MGWSIRNWAGCSSTGGEPAEPPRNTLDSSFNQPPLGLRRSLARSRSLSVKVSGQSYCKTSRPHRDYAELSGKRACLGLTCRPHLARDAVLSHLADLVEGVLPVSASVFEVVVGWERPVDVPRDGAVLRRLLSRQTTFRSVTGSEDWELDSERFDSIWRSTRTRTISRNRTGETVSLPTRD